MVVDSTTYKGVVYVGKGRGTLKLFDYQLTFSMYDPTAASKVKIFTLPWKKIEKRQVASSDVNTPKFKLILKSGTEAVFEMDDRISLEVLRDDMGERLARYKKLYPDSDDEAINKVKSTKAPRRQSTPYRMAKPAAAAATAPKPRRLSTGGTSSTAKRESQPYRMKAAPKEAAKPNPATAKRSSQPYRYVAK